VAYRKSNIGPSHRVAITEADAWTRGKIRVVNKPLGDVVKELARYHRGYFGVWNSTLAQRPVSGVFDIDDPVKALTTIQQTLGIASTRLTDRVIILHL
jgi:transmembrane sensor